MQMSASSSALSRTEIFRTRVPLLCLEKHARNLILTFPTTLKRLCYARVICRDPCSQKNFFLFKQIALKTYFFDNDQSHIDAFRGCRVKAIKVPGRDPWTPVPTSDPGNKALKKKLTNKALFYSNILDSTLGSSLYDSTSGLDPNYWEEYFRGFYTEAPGARIRVIFDFDRTLTQTEGFIRGDQDGFVSFKQKVGLPTLTVQDVLE